MEPRLDGWPQVGKTVNMAHVRFRAGRALFFDVRKLGRFGREIEIPQIRAVQHGICLIRVDIGQTEAGCLDRHQPTGELNRRVPAAALHIVGACARRLGNAGEISQQLCVFFKKHDVLSFFFLNLDKKNRPALLELADRLLHIDLTQIQSFAVSYP